jgi:hypothetical protein
MGSRTSSPDAFTRVHPLVQAVKQHAFYMKRAIDDANLKDALKHSSVMLSELRTSRLSPQKYYALFMRACDEMRYLEGFFSDLAKSGRRCVTWRPACQESSAGCWMTGKTAPVALSTLSILLPAWTRRLPGAVAGPRALAGSPARIPAGQRCDHHSAHTLIAQRSSTHTPSTLSLNTDGEVGWTPYDTVWRSYTSWYSTRGTSCHGCTF